MPDPNTTNLDASQVRQIQAQATLPSGNADDSGAEPTQSSPIGSQLQAPAARPVAQPMTLQPSQPAVVTPAVAPSKNPGLHSFINSFLSSTVGALAGKAPQKYVTDADGKIIPDPNQRPDTLGDKGRRLAAHALEGLGAGAQVQNRGSGLGNALAGMGAGASAVTADQRAADDKAKKEARENAEAAEQKKLRMHEIAKGNVLTASAWQHMMDTEQDRDPARQQHLDWAKAAEAAGVPVKYVSEDEAHEIRKSDPYAAAKFQVLPVGMKMVTDEQGQPVLDENGKPHMKGQFALIDGLHDGNIPAPASFVSDLNKYGQYAGLSKEEVAGLNAGDDFSMQHFIKLANAIQEGKKKELAGWEKPQIGWRGEEPVQFNGVTNEVRPFPTGRVPNVEN